jgi:hypothetical protein
MIRIPWTQICFSRDELLTAVLLLMAFQTAFYTVTGLNLLPSIPWYAVIKWAVGLFVHFMMFCMVCVISLFSHYILVFDLIKFFFLFCAGVELRNWPGTGHMLYKCVLVVMGVTIADILPRFPNIFVAILCIAAVFLFACILDLTIALVRTMRQVDALVYRRNNA